MSTFRPQSSFRPLSTRGAFVPSAPGGASPRTFAPLVLPPAAAFTSGVTVRPGAAETTAAIVAKLMTARAALTAPSTAPRLPEAPAPAPEPALAPTPHPLVTSATARQKDEAVADAVRLAEQTAAEFAEHEAARAAEHALLVADLEAQKQRTRATNERLGQLASDLVRVRLAMIEELRATAGSLLLMGARRLAGEALRTQPGLLEGLVTELVDTMAADSVTVRVNPGDVERLRETLGDRVRVVPDESIAAGCVVHGDVGSIDASIDVGMGALTAEVTAWRRTA